MSKTAKTEHRHQELITYAYAINIFDRSLDKPLRHVFKVKFPGCKNDYFDRNLNLVIFSVNYSYWHQKLKLMRFLYLFLFMALNLFLICLDLLKSTEFGFSLLSLFSSRKNYAIFCIDSGSKL